MPAGEVIILREFNPKRCLALVEKEKVTFLIGVPSIIALLARAQEHSPADISSLRGIVTMGSPFEKRLRTLPGTVHPQYFQWLWHNRNFLEHILRP